MTGFRVPAAKGAMVKGTRLAAINLQNTLVPLLKSKFQRIRTAQKSNGSCRGWGSCEESERDRSLLIARLAIAPINADILAMLPFPSRFGNNSYSRRGTPDQIQLESGIGLKK